MAEKKEGSGAPAACGDRGTLAFSAEESLGMRVGFEPAEAGQLCEARHTEPAMAVVKVTLSGGPVMCLCLAHVENFIAETAIAGADVKANIESVRQMIAKAGAKKAWRSEHTC
jgi:hypothetical protein